MERGRAVCVCGVIRGFIERSEETNESEEERRRRKSRERRERRCAAWLHNEILGQVKRRRRGSPSIPHRNPIPPTRRRRPTTFYFLGRKRQRNCRHWKNFKQFFSPKQQIFCDAISSVERASTKLINRFFKIIITSATQGTLHTVYVVKGKGFLLQRRRRSGRVSCAHTTREEDEMKDKKVGGGGKEGYGWKSFIDF
jgi:hypothetical protein